jgi:hypothetical protein
MTSRKGLSLVLLLAGLGACAGAAPPMNAEGPGAAIRAAEEVGADKIPEAALRLQLAKEQLERAKSMTSDNQQEGAHRLMMRSQADAELALALARSNQARASAEKAKEKTRNLPNTVR